MPRTTGRGKGSVRRSCRWVSERTLERYVQQGPFSLHGLDLQSEAVDRANELAALAPSSPDTGPPRPQLPPTQVGGGGWRGRVDSVQPGLTSCHHPCRWVQGQHTEQAQRPRTRRDSAQWHTTRDTPVDRDAKLQTNKFEKHKSRFSPTLHEQRLCLFLLDKCTCQKGICVSKRAS